MGWLYETIEVKIEKVLILGKDISYTQLFCFVLWQMAFGIKRSGRSRSLFVWLDPYLPNWKLHSCYHTVLAKETSEKAMATHSSTLAWKIPWMAEPGRLQSMGSLRVGHDWVTSLSLSCIGEGNGNPLQCSCLENRRDGGAWWAAVYGVAQSDTDAN